MSSSPKKSEKMLQFLLRRVLSNTGRVFCKSDKRRMSKYMLSNRTRSRLSFTKSDYNNSSNQFYSRKYALRFQIKMSKSYKILLLSYISFLKSNKVFIIFWKKVSNFKSHLLFHLETQMQIQSLRTKNMESFLKDFSHFFALDMKRFLKLNKKVWFELWKDVAGYFLHWSFVPIEVYC